MNDRAKVRDRIIHRAVKAVDKVRDKIQDAVEKEMQAAVCGWQKRWPRHAFKVGVAHGGLIVTVQPEVCTEGWAVRGAVKDFLCEIEILEDWLGELESGTGLIVGDTHWIRSDNWKTGE